MIHAYYSGITPMKNTINDQEALRADLIDIFEEVKQTVWNVDKRSRAGLMLGLQDLDTTTHGFIGGYFPTGSNIIIVNTAPIQRLLKTKRSLLRPYLFHVLLHEYIHACGFLDEDTVRQKTYEICKHQFGEDHPITQLSTDIQPFLPHLLPPTHTKKPANRPHTIELVPGFDTSNTTPYIS
jgi:hypothetical protein